MGSRRGHGDRLAAATSPALSHLSTSSWRSLVVATVFPTASEKKADVVECPEAFDHVGLLVNWSPGTAGLPFS
jgi:hypothetical protein